MKKSPLILYLTHHAVYTSGIINTILFTILLSVGCPVYHSGDELGISQILGGAFNMPPSACLPFLYGTHFIIGVPVKNLFMLFPGVNWFSLSLLIPQFFACIILYYVLLKRQKFTTATLWYITWFLVFETWMLSYLNISTTSMVCTIAGLAAIWHFFQLPTPRLIVIISGILIIIAGALIRLHSMAPVFATAAAFFLLLPDFKKKLWALGICITTLLLIIVLYKIQNHYYTTHCPDWAQEEAYRKAKYENINYYRDTTKLVTPYLQEQAMLAQLFLFDTTYPSRETLQLLASQTRSTMPANVFFSSATWHWDIVNNRIFLYAIVLAILFFFSGRKERAAAFLAILIAGGCAGYLMMFRKLPEYIIPGIIGTIVYFIALSGKYTTIQSPLRKIFLGVLLVSLWSWAVIRTYKINRHNAASFRQFQEVVQELNNHPDKLFINIGEGELFSYFYCFAKPVNYSFKNILFIDHPIASRQSALMTDFGISDIRKAPLYDNIYFRGPAQPVLADYFSKILQRPVRYSNTIPGFKHSTIRKLIVD